MKHGVKLFLIIFIQGILTINLSCSQKEDSKDYIIIDDFEKYPNTEPGAIFDVWTDGFETEDNGAYIGHVTEPFMETQIVHSGSQSAPIYYDFVNCKFSEISIGSEFLPIGTDWTRYSSNLLSLWFYGDKENIPLKMYIKIDDSKVYYPEENNLKKSKWIRWNINLSEFSTDLQNISKFSIGFEESDGHPKAYGMIFIDDIRLYKRIQ